MSSLPKNVRRGRKGRIGILKRIPKDLWEHPAYRGKAKLIERSTGALDEKKGVEIAQSMLAELDRQFERMRAELRAVGDDRPLPPPGPAKTKKKTPATRVLSQAGEQTRRDIIAAAMTEFSQRGLRGARVDRIAAQTRTTKPMIYYHFGSKDGLYAAVMVEAYGGMRDLEQRLNLKDLPPLEAMRRLVEATFDHHALHPEYVRLIAAENMEYACHIEGLPPLVERNAVAIETIRDLLQRGERDGVFRPGINPWHLHLLINSYSFMRVSNRYTWRAIFQLDLWAPEEAIAQRRLLVEATLRFVRVEQSAVSQSARMLSDLEA